MFRGPPVRQVVRQPAAGIARGPCQPAMQPGARPHAAGAGDCSHTQAGQDHGRGAGRPPGRLAMRSGRQGRAR
jgi:hypothetical protein